MMNDLKSYFEKYAALTENFLSEYFEPCSEIAGGLTACMRYTLLNGGKRLRAIIAFASADVFGVPPEYVLPYAASVETMHAYSLIHDDLPAMDNDDMRRGKPSNHKVYGEASAILAGDALLTKAFEMISDDRLTGRIKPETRLAAVNALSVAAGDKGMVAGQYADMMSENKKADGHLVEFIHGNKTGALITYSALIGALLGGTDKDAENMRKYGRSLGMAFQITDDILDITSSGDIMGKSAGKDEKSGKSTYPSVYGLEKSKEMAVREIAKCTDALKSYGERADILNLLALFVLERKS